MGLIEDDRRREACKFAECNWRLILCDLSHLSGTDRQRRLGGNHLNKSLQSGLSAFLLKQPADKPSVQQTSGEATKFHIKNNFSQTAK